MSIFTDIENAVKSETLILEEDANVLLVKVKAFFLAHAALFTAFGFALGVAVGKLG